MFSKSLKILLLKNSLWNIKELIENQNNKIEEDTKDIEIVLYKIIIIINL